jgi:hypothetical protein
VIKGIHSPGNSPGIQNYLDLLTSSGGNASVTLELWDNITSNTPVACDQIIVGTDRDFADPTTLSLDFVSPGDSSVDWANSFWDIDQQWTLFSVGNSTTNFSNYSLTDNVSTWLDSTSTALGTARPGRTFSISQG